MTGDDRAWSVAMATYQGARHLRAQLDSISKQTRQPSELVICDDASSDQSRAIAEEFAKGASFPIRIVTHEVNRGTCPTFESAVAACSGEFIALADQDDVWRTDKLEKLQRALEGEGEPAVAFSNAMLVQDDLTPMRHSLFEALRLSPHEREQITTGRALDVLLRRNVIAGATMAFRRELTDVVLPIAVDRAHDWWIAVIASAVASIDLVEEPLLDYRQHGGQQVGERRRSSIEQLRVARRMAISDFEWVHAFFVAALDRLESLGPERVSEAALAAVRGKVEHTRIRVAMRRAERGRIRLALGEWARGRYQRYSLGWKAFAQDLFIV